ncbi:SHOCT domain-containing protein [Paenarthrobacter aurescens]|uniref:SHOCT domain-containing protein n=1 Tax=Paenarthrobacter aurescens TaxID=43663 RepID=UPI0021BF532F|nr:SHOCT domain-containing protein [Paenarthrobacter aurescens]MCT9870815.1 SHOCT domain-containing protein [Paenarthrobacter aurescens]
MMWGYGQGMVWMWLWIPLLLIGIALLVLLALRVFGAGRGGYAPTGPQGPDDPLPMKGSRARQILEERFAKGELTADQYREYLNVLGEDH